MIFKNANVFLPNDGGFVKQDVLVCDNKIAQIASCIDDTDVVDASQKYLMPGYIDAHCHLGLQEEGLRWEGNDVNEYSSNFTPSIRAIDGINPRCVSFAEARNSGVTTVCTGPGSANIIGGQFCIISTYGDIVDNMIIKGYAAMKCAFGENPKGAYGQSKKSAPYTRMGTAQILRKALFDTINYIAKKEEASKATGENKKHFEKNMDFEALIPVIEKQVPLKVHAHRADDIATAIRISREFNVLLTLDHCTEGHLIAEHIKASGFSAIVGPTFGSRSKPELNNKTFETPKMLFEAGVKIAIMTDHPVIPQYGLNICVMLAVKAGLPEIEGLKSITSNAAEILGIGDFKGKIQVGYDADLVLWDRHPLDIQAKADLVMINGVVV